MPIDAYPPHLGWADPGDPLRFKRDLEAEGRWPPKVAQDRRDDDRIRPATPFLVIPETLADIGTTQRMRWATSPSLLLLSGDGKLETAPRKGVSYRILAIVRNAGDAPSLTTFAEFAMVTFTEVDLDGAGEIPEARINPDEFAVATELGVTAFGVAAGSVAWVLSRDSWTCPDDPGPFLFAAVRVFDPLHDGARGGWKSREDRKTALRFLAPNVDGSWSGRQIRTKPDGTQEDIGLLSVRVNPGAQTLEDPDGSGDVVVTIRVVIDSYGDVSGNFAADQQVPLRWDGFALKGRRVRPGVGVGGEVYMDFARKDGELVSRVFADGDCEALMRPVAQLPMDIDPDQLPFFDPVVPPTWPAFRREDAALIRGALAALRP